MIGVAGAGPAGQVWRALQDGEEAPVSVTIAWLDAHAADAAPLGRLRELAGAMPPGALPRLEVIDIDGRPSLVEYPAPGIPLSAALGPGARPPLRATLELMAAVIASLQEAHAANLGHGALHPDRILVSAEHPPVLLGTGQIGALSGAQPSEQTDAHGVGAMLYELISGSTPGAALTGGAVRHASDLRRALFRLRVALEGDHAEIVTAVGRALSIDDAERGTLDDLRRAISDELEHLTSDQDLATWASTTLTDDLVASDANHPLHGRLLHEGREPSPTPVPLLTPPPAPRATVPTAPTATPPHLRALVDALDSPAPAGTLAGLPLPGLFDMAPEPAASEEAPTGPALPPDAVAADSPEPSTSAEATAASTETRDPAPTEEAPTEEASTEVAAWPEGGPSTEAEGAEVTTAAAPPLEEPAAPPPAPAVEDAPRPRPPPASSSNRAWLFVMVALFAIGGGALLVFGVLAVTTGPDAEPTTPAAAPAPPPRKATPAAAPAPAPERVTDAPSEGAESDAEGTDAEGTDAEGTDAEGTDADPLEANADRPAAAPAAAPPTPATASRAAAPTVSRPAEAPPTPSAPAAAAPADPWGLGDDVPVLDAAKSAPQGTARLRGDAYSVRLVSGSRGFGDGELPAGSYTVRVIYESGDPEEDGGSATVVAGQTVTVTCKAKGRTCAAK